MGAVITVDFRRRERAQAAVEAGQEPLPIAGPTALPCAFQLLCLYAPMLALWGICCLPLAGQSRT
jgi:hypothetical protein